MTNIRNAMMAVSGGGDAGYVIENSVLLDGSSYMTHASGVTRTDIKISTFSVWVKRGNIDGTTQNIWGGEKYNTNQDQTFFNSSEQIDHFIDATGSASDYGYTTTAVYRDPSAWIHIYQRYDSTDATAADRIRTWINGVETTSLSKHSGGDVPLNEDNGFMQSGLDSFVGATLAGANPLDGYMAEFIFLDGNIEEVTAFGEFDDQGYWRPIDPSGVDFSGTGSLWLDFAVAPGTGNGAGTDVSGNTNHFTDSGLAAADKVSDSPTNNFCTIASNSEPMIATTGVWTVANGNTEAGLASGTGDMHYRTTMRVSEGEWYWEDTVGTQGAWGDMFGILEIDTGGMYSVHNYNGTLNSDTTTNSTSGGAQGYGSGLSSGDTVCNHLDLESGEYSMKVNAGSWREQLTGMSGAWAPMVGMNNQTASFQGNWGTSPRSSGGNADDNGYGDFDYAPPTNALSLCTANMTALDFDPAEHHQVELVNNDYIAYGAGTVIGDMTDSTAGNALANAFDDTTVSDDNGYSSAKRGTVTDAFAGKDWGSGVSRTINRFDVWDVNNAGYFDNTSEGRIHLYGSDSTPSNATDGTVLFSSAAFNSTVASQPKSYDVSDGIITTTAYRYHWVAFVPTSSASNVRCGEIQFYENFFTLGWNADTYDTLFIIKNRDNAEKWFWVDGLNGYNKYTSSDATTAQTPDANVISVSGTTITLGSTLSSDNYVVECHRAGAAAGDKSNGDGSITSTVSANTTSGFAIILHDMPAGTSAYTYGHGLSSQPEMQICKRMDSTSNWYVSHKGLTDETGYYLKLDLHNDENSSAGVWGAGPTDDVLGQKADGLFPASTAGLTTYTWHSVEGYSAFGSYEGNSGDGPVVNVGIAPVSYFVKDIDATGWWQKMETVGGCVINGDTNATYYNSTYVETDENSGSQIDALSVGFKPYGTSAQTNTAGTYIYSIWGTSTVNKSGTPAKAR